MPATLAHAVVFCACFGAVVWVLLALAAALERRAEQRQLRTDAAPGRLVAVGKQHLHLLDTGTTGPTVVIEQGAGEPAKLWWPLQQRLAAVGRVCTYDRAGSGYSDALAGPQSIDERAEALHQLLTAAALPAPYILLAHSYGGLLVRAFARAHAAEVAALVLLDSPEEGTLFQPQVIDFYRKVRGLNRVFGALARIGVLRLLSRVLDLQKIGFWLSRGQEYDALCDELASLERLPKARRHPEPAGTLGQIPLVVVTHGQPFPGPFAVLEKNWLAGQKRLAALSHNSVLVIASHSNHMIQHDEPELVLDVLARVCEAVRMQQPLWRVFPQPQMDSHSLSAAPSAAQAQG